MYVELRPNDRGLIRRRIVKVPNKFGKKVVGISKIRLKLDVMIKLDVMKMQKKVLENKCMTVEKQLNIVCGLSHNSVNGFSL